MCVKPSYPRRIACTTPGIFLALIVVLGRSEAQGGFLRLKMVFFVASKS